MRGSLCVLLATVRTAATSNRPTQARYHCSPAWPPANRQQPTHHRRDLDPTLSLAATSPECDATFCVGPPTCYPTTPAPAGPALVWEAEFDVPPLPSTFNSTTMTDYIYFNIVFGYGECCCSCYCCCCCLPARKKKTRGGGRLLDLEQNNTHFTTGSHAPLLTLHK